MLSEEKSCKNEWQSKLRGPQIEECYKSNRRILEGRSKEYKEEIHHALGGTRLKSSEIANDSNCHH